MRLLIDTHALLWFHSLDARLGKPTRTLIESGDHVCCYSIVSLWEISIKHGLGKLKLAEDLASTFVAMERSNLILLELDRKHIVELGSLPLHHRDPFDRMLIAQARHEGMHLVSSDAFFKLYDVPLIDP